MDEEKGVQRVKMSKEIVPEGFSRGLVFVDLLPVLYFGGTGILLGLLLQNWIVISGSVIAFVSGFLKVVWKYIVATKKKNIWPLFIQMRIFMPIGMLMLLAGIIICIISGDAGEVWKVMLQFPQIILFLLGIGGMGMMGYFAIYLDSADPMSNWIEQLTNTIAQLLIFIGMVLVYFHK